MEVSRLAPQCCHEPISHSRLNHGSSYTSLPSRGSPNLDPIEWHGRPRNGHLPTNTPCYVTNHLQSSDDPRTYSFVPHTNENDWHIPRQQNGRKFVHFQDGQKKVLQQHPNPPKMQRPAGSPVMIRELQASPVHRYKTRARYNYQPPRKPPRSYSQTSLTKSPVTRGSYTSLCSSASQPYGHMSRGPAEWSCPQAPLAEDEVKDAYALIQPKGG